MTTVLIFKTVLTTILFLNYTRVFLVGKEKEGKYTAGEAFINIVVATVIIYGLWTWL